MSLDPAHPTRPATLRAIVLATSGQDVRRCQHCEFCYSNLAPDQDISLESLLQLVVMNDEEVLTCRTLWSDAVLDSSRHVCGNNLDIEGVLLALRDEARRRGLDEEIGG